MRQNKSMAKRNTSKRTSAPIRKSPGNKGKLYETFMGLGLWILGLFNVVLIASFVMKHMGTGNEQVISVSEPVITRTIENKISFEVLNGCGIPGIAAKFATKLEDAGHQPKEVGNFDNFNMPQTIIFDRQSQNRLNGLKVAELLGLPATAVVYQAKNGSEVDVSVILGKDYQKATFLREPANQ
ncbi:MAG: LytR C-terminal domain-containing protein [Deferribacteres bacterium]|nr:LytR C-terminal domain-containing protein [Deferribacteres bacterium]